jgi:hypothetical protein
VVRRQVNNQTHRSTEKCDREAKQRTPLQELLQLSTPPHSIRTGHPNHLFKTLPRLCTHHRRLAAVVTKSGFITSDECFLAAPFSYCRLDIPCCPRWKRNPRATFVNVHSIECGKLLRFKGEELWYGPRLHCKNV